MPMSDGKEKESERVTFSDKSGLKENFLSVLKKN